VPTVWKQGKIKFSIYKEKNSRLPHVHAYLGNSNVSISLDGIILTETDLSTSDLKAILGIIADNKIKFEEKWKELNDD
jgi:hypothetical protein